MHSKTKSKTYSVKWCRS